ncbi:STM4015 family protein [Streptomyces sp. NPDC001228]|uniref:STM4015 family protein n=1 Tax=Streptomyces sp. NPDC001228 TaxID=3154381 RepID=UPI00331BC15C
MTINDHLATFCRLPARTFPGPGAPADSLPDAGSVAWRITSDVYDADEDWADAFARFLDTVDTTEVRALIVGAWQEAYDTAPTGIIEALLAARDRLPALRGLFLGDMVMEECEISWINQTDVTPLLEAFPELEEFGVRGGSGLGFTGLRHTALRSLTMESGGLPAQVVRGVSACDLPALTDLDLWLGTPDYGGDSEVSDLEGILSGARLPSLRRLALRNSEIQDQVATAVAGSAVLGRLEVLDLSMGVLTDEGATALLDGGPLTHLKKLDLHHNYLTGPLRDRVRGALEPAGVEVDLGRGDADEDKDDDGTVWRYVAVGE